MREDDIRPRALLDEFFTLLAGDARAVAARREEFVDVDCVFCGGRESRAEFEKDGFPFRSCLNCGSLYASPRPSAELLLEFARTAKATRFWSSHFYPVTAAARTEKIFRPRAKAIAELVDGDKPEQSVLADVGAGYGLFLEEARKLDVFARLIAIEPDAMLAQLCEGRGLPVIPDWVEDIEDGRVDADIVTAFEVLEHVFDPLAFLRACARIARKGGRVVLTTLSAGGFDIAELWDRSRSISPPQHLNFPTVRGLELLAERAGFSIESVTTPGQLDVDIVRNVLLAEPHAPLSRVARLVALAPEPARVDFQQFLQRHRLSSHIRLIARRI